MTTFVWGGSMSAYGNPANWAPMGIPGPGDVAVIASGGAETEGATLLDVEIQLGSEGMDGTLAATAPSDTNNAGGLDDGGFVTTAALAGAEGNLNIAGDFNVGEAALYVGGESSRLTVTLAPAASGAPGLLVAEAGSPFPSVVGYVSSTLLIAPLSASVANQVAFENNGEADTGGGTLIDEVPTYANGGLGSFEVGGGTAEFGSSVADQQISLDKPSVAAPPPTLVIDQPSAFQATIGSDVGPGDEFRPAGLPVGTTIDLRDLSATSLAFSQGGQAGSQAIELVNGTVVDTLNLVAGTAAFGVSLAPDGTGGTLLRVDVSSNSSALGGAAIDPAAVQIAGTRAEFSVSVGSNGTTLTGLGFTDLVTPGASLQFIDGEEFVSPSSQGGTLYRFYETALARVPDAAGLTYWNNVFNEGIGATATDIAAGILSSPEYRSDAFGLSNADFVDRLYIDGLGRTPDPSGDAFWNSLLAGGTSQAQVLASFVTTPEAVQHSAAAFSEGLFVPAPA